MQNPSAAPQPIPIEIAPTPTGPMRPLTQAEIRVIRDHRSEMSSQLNSAVDRRNDLVGELREAPAGTQQGILDRIQVLDARILQIEKDIAESGRQLTSGLVPQATVLVPPNVRFGGMSEETQAILGVSFSVFFLLPIAIGFMRLMWRRGRRRDLTAQGSPEHTARLERLEQAVDAVAIEIERVGEAQRYQARVLTGANLMPALESGQPAAEPIRVRAMDEVRAGYVEGRNRT